MSFEIVMIFIKLINNQIVVFFENKINQNSKRAPFLKVKVLNEFSSFPFIKLKNFFTDKVHLFIL